MDQRVQIVKPAADHNLCCKDGFCNNALLNEIINVFMSPFNTELTTINALHLKLFTGNTGRWYKFKIYKNGEA